MNRWTRTGFDGDKHFHWPYTAFLNDWCILANQPNETQTPSEQHTTEINRSNTKPHWIDYSNFRGQNRPREEDIFWGVRPGKRLIRNPSTIKSIHLPTMILNPFISDIGIPINMTIMIINQLQLFQQQAMSMNRLQIIRLISLLRTLSLSLSIRSISHKFVGMATIQSTNRI